MNIENIEFIPARIKDIKKIDNIFHLYSEYDEYLARSVVIATGTDEKKLNLPNEKELLGHGLSYCAICDGHFFKDKITMVVAEDKYALSEAIYLAGLSKEVIVVTSFKELKGNSKLIEELKSFNNVKYIYQDKVVSLNGYPLSSVSLAKSGEVKVDGIFPLLGYIPNTKFLDEDLLDEDGFVITDDKYETKIPGMFAVGDVLTRELKQIYIAVNDANRATTYIEQYLK